MTLQATFRQDGLSIDYTPGSAVDAGTPVSQQGYVGIPKVDIAANALGALAVTGLFDFVKVTGALAVGDVIYWDSDGDPVGGTAGTGAATGVEANGDFVLGTCTAAAVSAGAIARTNLNDWPGNSVLDSFPVVAAIADMGAETQATMNDSSTGTDPGDDIIAAITSQVAITNSGGGVDVAAIAAGVGVQQIVFPVEDMAATGAGSFGATNSGDFVTAYVPGYNFKILSLDFMTDVPGTGSSATATFTMEIGGAAVTTLDCIVTLAGTDTRGKLTAGTAATAANTGNATANIDIVKATSTVFTAGSGSFILTIQNMDVADAFAAFATEQAVDITAELAVTAAIAQLAAKVNAGTADSLLTNAKIDTILAGLRTAGVIAT